MSERAKTFAKYGCLGCAGVLAIGALMLGVLVAVMWMAARSSEPESVSYRFEPAARPAKASEPADAAVEPAPSAAGESVAMAAESAAEAPAPPILVDLELGPGGVAIRRGAPGSAISVEGTFDPESYSLRQWEDEQPGYAKAFHVEMQSLRSGLTALFYTLFAEDPRVRIRIPPDVPVELHLTFSKGGLEADLGGLWLTAFDATASMGGVAIDVSEPTRQPLERFRISGEMGGLAIRRLGNASPGSVEIGHRMGGLQADLRGSWQRDARISIEIAMGGGQVIVPGDVAIAGLGGPHASKNRPRDPEQPQPLLEFRLREESGKIDVEIR